MDAGSGERDFFVSYRTADQAWAEWIAWELEAAGYTVFVQAWDFRPGQNFVHQMQQGASSCRRTIAVLTPAYFESGFTRAEWYSAFAKDAAGEAGLLLPVRVEPCDVDGLLGQIIYIDLVGLEKTQARERLLAGIKRTRAKPPQPPPFPDIFGDKRDLCVIPPLPPPSAEDRRGLLILLDRVKQFWVEGVLERSVQHEALINLGKEAKADVVEHPWKQVLELPDAASKALPDDTRITDVFEDVGRLLLILGEPGSGKTMTLLELARDLLASARSDPGQPVPVVFTLSSWSEEFETLSDWLMEELKTKYLIPKRIGRPWLDGNRLLPLLDGLDEVQADRRADCIRAINAFLEEQGTPGLAVCSRLEEYVAEPVRLKMNGAIRLQPLTATQIETYLSRLGSQLDALRAALHQDDLLRDLAKSPLMLSVMTLAYQGASVGALAGEAAGTPEARRKHLFDAYVARMFARKDKGGGIAPAKEESKRWLSWLAHNMQRHDQSLFMIEQMQPSWLNDLRGISIYLFLSRLAYASFGWGAITSLTVIIMLTHGVQQIVSEVDAAAKQFGFGSDRSFIAMIHGAQMLAFLLGAISSCFIELLRHNMQLARNDALGKIANNSVVVILAHMLGWTAAFALAHVFLLGEKFLDSESDFILWSGIVFGLIFGLVSCRRSVSQDIRIRDRLAWSWAKPLRATIIVVAYVSLYFLIVYLWRLVDALRDYADNVRPFMDLFRATIPLVLTFWLPLSFLLGLQTAVREVDDVSNYGIRSAVANAGRAGLGMFACGMLGFGYLFVGGGLSSFTQAMGLAAAGSIIPAVTVALAYGGADVINHYVLRFVARRNGYIPKRLRRFLEHCTKLVFLRKVGGGYIFIHRLILEHFAAMWEAERRQTGSKTPVAPDLAVAARS